MDEITQAIQEILAKDVSIRTEDDINFLIARRSYLNAEQRAELVEVLPADEPFLDEAKNDAIEAKAKIEKTLSEKGTLAEMGLEAEDANNIKTDEARGAETDSDAEDKAQPVATEPEHTGEAVGETAALESDEMISDDDGSKDPDFKA